MSSPHKVIEVVAKDFGVEIDDILSATRGKREAAFARQVAMYLCHVVLSYKYQEVGNFFGRERTVVPYSCRKIEDKRDNGLFDQRLDRLEDIINGKNN